MLQMMTTAREGQQSVAVEHRGKTSAHAQVLENIVGNLNPVS